MSLSLQRCKMGLFAHLFPRPPRVPSVRHGASGLPVSGWRRSSSPADLARSPPGAAHFPFLGLFFLLCKNGDNDSTSHEGRCEGFHERIHFKQPAPSAALGDPGGSDPLPLSPSAGSSETKISPRAPPCGGRGNATQRSRQGLCLGLWAVTVVAGVWGGVGVGRAGRWEERGSPLSLPSLSFSITSFPDSPMPASGWRWGWW